MIIAQEMQDAMDHEMGKMLFANQDDLEWSDIYRYANALGLDLERFDQDVRVHPTKVLHRVQDDAQDAELMDLNSTPTFFVNGTKLKGGATFEDFKKLIDPNLKS